MSDFRQMIRDMIQDVLENDEELEEVSSVTGMAGGDAYNTPFAFTGDSEKNKELKTKMIRRANPDWEEMWDDDEKPKKPRKWSVELHEAKDDEVVTIYVNGDPFWLRKAGDSTHFFLSTDKRAIKKGGWVYHVGQVRDEPYYKDVVKWLHGGKIDGKKYKVNENINEVNQTSDTQFADLSGKKLFNSPLSYEKKKEWSKYIAELYGWKVVDPEMNKIVPEYIPEKATAKNLTEGRRGHYHDFRDDDSRTTRQKIGQSVREIYSELKEVEKRIDMNLRLKEETGITTDKYWSRTRKSLGRLNELMNRIIYKMKKF